MTKSHEKFWSRLETHGSAIALVSPDGRQTTYAELADLADEFARRLPAERQLVALEARNELHAVVAYIACLRHHHPVILLDERSVTDGPILQTYRPDWLCAKQNGDWRLDRLQGAAKTAFADELAVLLTTSGTTRNPKLVRLSHQNIASNAGSICRYLGITADERAITTLGYYYSYGMAVLNSHLAAGARILLTEEPIITERFWSYFVDQGATRLALVPYHFELLDRIGFADRDLPTLRTVTQAGGRLHADKIKRYARLGRDRGWRFFVMYGQTEASPRMSYVPPDDLLDHLDSIGRPIDDGDIALLDEHGNAIDGVGQPGELVYRGPNVMLGYADSRADLAKPRDTQSLHTGDMAERLPDGYFKIVGRMKRFIKLYGLRINLDDVEVYLNGLGYVVHCAGTDERLAVFSADRIAEHDVKVHLQAAYDIQPAHVACIRLEEMPLLASGKIDYRALNARINADDVPSGVSGNTDLRGEFRRVSASQEIDGDDTFERIGGDSLAYLNIAMCLEERLGYVPRDWEGMSIRQLELLEPARTGSSFVPMASVIRAVAIVSVVVAHMTYWPIEGGAITLMFLAGFFFAKIHSTNLVAGHSFKILRSALLRILVFYYIIITAYGMFHISDPDFDFLKWYFLFANFYYYPSHIYLYWFILAYAQLITLFVLVWALPGVRHVFSGKKLEFGYAMLAVGLISAAVSKATSENYDLYVFSPFSHVGLFALGWIMAYSQTRRSRVLLSVLLVGTAFAFWSGYRPQSQALFLSVCGLCAIWFDKMPMPRIAAAAISWVAACSFYVYLAQFAPIYLRDRQLLPDTGPDKLAMVLAAVVLSLALGGVAHYVADRAVDALRKMSPKQVAHGGHRV